MREVRRAGVGVAVTAVFPAPTPGPRRAASASSCPPVRSAAGPLPGAARDAGSGDQGSHGQTGPRGRHVLLRWPGRSLLCPDRSGARGLFV